jgi:hypothetical protein
MGTFPVELSWYRVFSLPDFAGSPWDVTGSFNITRVHVGCSSTLGTPTLNATVYSYTGSDGTLFSSTIDQSYLTQIGQGSAQVSSQTCNADVAIPVSVSQPIQAGAAFVVQVGVIETLDYDSNVVPSCSIDPAFDIGANSSTELRRSYFQSPTSGCAATTPTQSTGSADVLIAVEGTAD